MKTFVKPPALVHLTMEGVCILLQVTAAQLAAPRPDYSPAPLPLASRESNVPLSLLGHWAGPAGNFDSLCMAVSMYARNLARPSRTRGRARSLRGTRPSGSWVTPISSRGEGAAEARAGCRLGHLHQHDCTSQPCCTQMWGFVNCDNVYSQRPQKHGPILTNPNPLSG